MKCFEITTEPNTTLNKEEFYTYIDNTSFSNTIKETLKEMSAVVLSSGENDIKLDFDDFNVIVNHGDIAYSGIGEYDGEDSASEAIKSSIINSKLDKKMMHKITGVLIHFVMHPEYSIIKIADAMDIVHENVHYESEVIWGTTTDTSLSKEYVKVTALFNGFEKNDHILYP